MTLATGWPSLTAQKLVTDILCHRSPEILVSEVQTIGQKEGRPGEGFERLGCPSLQLSSKVISH